MQNQGKKNSSQNSEPSIKTLAISAPPSSSSTSFHLGQNSLSHTHTHTLSLALSRPRTKTETNKCTISATSRDKLQTKTGGSVSSQRCRRSGSHGWVWYALLCDAVLFRCEGGKGKQTSSTGGGKHKGKRTSKPSPPHFVPSDIRCVSNTYVLYFSCTMDDWTISRPSLILPRSGRSCGGLG